mgnify:CR=1 FL=1
MKSKEEINMLGFTIVAYAGDARLGCGNRIILGSP